MGSSRKIIRGQRCFGARGHTRAGFPTPPARARELYLASATPVYYPQTGQAYLGRREEFFLGAKGGHNSESHNHNDVGNFVLFANCLPVLVNLGVNANSYGRVTEETGLSKYDTFSVNSDYHNCPAPNGVRQSPGISYCASSSECEPSEGYYRLDIAGAYPSESSCRSLFRTFSLDGSKMILSDLVSLRSRTGADKEYFMTPCTVSAEREGCLILTYGSAVSVRMKYPLSLSVEVEQVNLVEENSTLSDYWGETINRIVLTSAVDAPLENLYRFEFEIL